MRLCDKHIPAEMYRQKCTNHFAERNVTIHCYIFVRNVTIGHFCTEYACHITPQNMKFSAKKMKFSAENKFIGKKIKFISKK